MLKENFWSGVSERWRINSSLQRGDQPVFVAHLREADGGLWRLSRLCGARRRQSDFLKRQTVVLVNLTHSLSLHVFPDRVTGSNEVLTSPGAAASNVTKLAHQIASFLNLSMIAISNIHVDILSPCNSAGLV